jgi:hypothetical protein
MTRAGLEGGGGFQPITDLGAGLEQASEENERGRARKMLSELSSYLDSVGIVI